MGLNTTLTFPGAGHSPWGTAHHGPDSLCLRASGQGRGSTSMRGRSPENRGHGPACGPADPPPHRHLPAQACSLQTSRDRPPEAATTRLPSAQIPFSTLLWFRVQMVFGGSVGTCTRMVLSVDVVYKAPSECLIPVI